MSAFVVKQWTLRTLVFGATSAIALQSALAAETGEVETLVVTARKTEETLLQVPVAVSAFSAQDLERRDVTDISGVVQFTPGFSQNTQSLNRNDRGYNQRTLRGITPATQTPTRQTVTIFIDGAPINGGNISGLDDIERVEVVKGPQSAYFGRSTFAGAVNLVTRAPSYDFRAKFKADVATRNGTDLSASIETGLVPGKLAARIGGRSYHTDGGYSNVGYPGQRVGDRDTKSGTLSLLAEPSDNLTIRFFGNIWRDSDGMPANASINSDYYNCNAGAAPTTTLNYFCGPIRTAPEATRTYNTVLSPTVLEYLQGRRGPGYTYFGPDFIDHFGLERHAVQLHSTFEYRVPNGYVVSGNAAYDHDKWAFLTDTALRDGRNIPNANFGRIADVLSYYSSSALGNNDIESWSGELRVASPASDRFRWLGGFNYYRGRFDGLTNLHGVAGFVTTSLANIENWTYGIFGSASYDITDAISANFEARVQWDTISSKTANNARGTFRSFTPRVILQYKPTADFSTYASYSRGSRPGEFNNALPPQLVGVVTLPRDVPEESLDMWEIGAKGLFFERRLQILASAYYGQWLGRHIPQVYSYVQNGSAVLLNQIAAGGKVRLTGIETEATFKVAPHLTLDATFGIAATSVRQTYCSNCLTLTGNANPRGTQLPNYPKFTSSLSATYDHDLSATVNGYIRVDYFFQSKQFETESNLAWTPSISRVNLRVGATYDNYRLEVYGTNITNNLTPIQAAFNTDAFTRRPAVVVSLPEKATYGLRLSAQF